MILSSAQVLQKLPGGTSGLRQRTPKMTLPPQSLSGRCWLYSPEIFFKLLIFKKSCFLNTAYSFYLLKKRKIRKKISSFSLPIVPSLYFRLQSQEIDFFFPCWYLLSFIAAEDFRAGMWSLQMAQTWLVQQIKWESVVMIHLDMLPFSDHWIWIY